MSELLLRDDIKILASETEVILKEAESFKIQTNVTYQLAADELKKIKGAAKRLDDLRKSITAPMDAAKKAVMDFFRGPSEQLETAERKIKGAMQAYQAELEIQAQKARREAEAAAQAERERIAIEAAKAAEQGRIEDAQQIAQTIAEVKQEVALVTETPKVAGISYREVWKFDITDANLIPREYLIVDEAAIRKVVTALKDKASIPGVRVYSENQISAGR